MPRQGIGGVDADKMFFRFDARSKYPIDFDIVHFNLVLEDNVAFFIHLDESFLLHIDYDGRGVS